jgi:hypothetical protein
MTQKRWAWLALGVLILAGILFGLGQWIGNWFWHPIAPCSVPAAQFAKCKGYNFWSGIGADVGEITLIVSLISGIVWFRTHFQCHEETCRKVGMHHVPGTPYRTCWHHHPVLSAHKRGKVPLERIRAAHAAANAPPDSVSVGISHPDAVSVEVTPHG